MEVPGGASSDRRHWHLRLLWLAGALSVAVTSLLPETSDPLQLLAELPVSDKVLHFTAYTLVACVPSIHERLLPAVLQLAATIGLGIGLEFAQDLVGRSFEVADMFADAWGVLSGVIVGLVLRRHLRRRALRPATRG